MKFKNCTSIVVAGVLFLAMALFAQDETKKKETDTPQLKPLREKPTQIKKDEERPESVKKNIEEKEKERILLKGSFEVRLSHDGVIIAIAIPALREMHREAKLNAEKTACRASLKGVETALEFFYNENDRYVTDKEGLKELVKLGKLKKGQIKDPWKNIWDYKAVKSPGGVQAQRYYLRSVGPDGKRNTEDDINSENYPWP